ncbi:T7SS effector LXG polymorphic toxin [Oceanobacillus sp. HCA-5259]|uniref:T7SS effector LXG polymorphic toxin n=1 Tax=Oceanobacillus sp. HCA-5259 TaxID=3134661 RepID=UPI0030BD689F
MSRLINEEISEMKEKMADYQDTISQVAYEQFKTATVLANTLSLRGTTGDSFRTYMNLVHLNLTQKIINIAEEIRQAVDQMETIFLDFESHASGKVETDTLERVTEKVQNSNNVFDALDGKSGNLLSRASKFIATTNLPSQTVQAGYRDSIQQLNTFKQELSQTDSRAANDLSRLVERVETLKQQIADLSTVYRNQNGINYDKIGDITSEAWYSNENTAAFADMVEDDPFVSETTRHAFYEDQWVAGVNGDVFASYDHALFYADGSHKVENGVTTFQGGAGVYQGNGHAQVTDYLTADGTVSVGQVKGDVSYGNGIALNAEGHAAKLEGTAMLGTENFNGHVSASAEALSGDAHFVIQPKDDNGEYKFHIGGGGALWKAEANAGIELFGVKDISSSAKDYKTDNSAQMSLFGVDIAGSVGKQVSAELEASSTKVFETKVVDVHADRLKIDLSFGLGVKLDLQYPTLNWKWPW